MTKTTTKAYRNGAVRHSEQSVEREKKRWMNPVPIQYLSLKSQGRERKQNSLIQRIQVTSSKLSTELWGPFLSSREQGGKVQGLSKSVGLTCHGTGNGHPLILCVSRKINFILPLFSDYNALKPRRAAGCVSYKRGPNEAINQVLEQKAHNAIPQRPCPATAVLLKPPALSFDAVCLNRLTMADI